MSEDYGVTPDLFLSLDTMKGQKSVKCTTEGLPSKLALEQNLK